MSEHFADRVVLVTGGSSGIGKAAALAFAREGTKVVVSARRSEEGEQVAHQIKEAGGESIFVRADVGKREDVEALFQTTIATYGRLDFAFNNAGIEGTPGILTAEYSE